MEYLCAINSIAWCMEQAQGMQMLLKANFMTPSISSTNSTIHNFIFESDIIPHSYPFIRFRLLFCCCCCAEYNFRNLSLMRSVYNLIVGCWVCALWIKWFEIRLQPQQVSTNNIYAQCFYPVRLFHQLNFLCLTIMPLHIRLLYPFHIT